GLEYTKANQVLPTMGLGCKFPAQFVQESAILDIRPAIDGVYRSVPVLPTVIVAAPLQQLGTRYRGFCWIILENALPHLGNKRCRAIGIARAQQSLGLHHEYIRVAKHGVIIIQVV